MSEPHKPELPETLAKLKLKVDPVILARTVATDLHGVDLKAFDLMALYSPSDVKALIQQASAGELPHIATFGEGTLRAAIEAGMTVKASAPSPEAPSMARAVEIYLERRAKNEEIADVELKTDTEKEEFIRTQQHKLAKKSRSRRTAAPSAKK